ncbi:aminoglycoside phosphotransferase [Tateyamaria omphalii]|uniref:aminoglycoside phosphotransferase family protein n=1 Tax=Tateyamaria omphalii TaxID=299262 RepID=UPI00167A8756|nr:phosphotransferase [Tateyamaria omphalii]GGX39705.1 aminoglycoside phosphotransferase [Tateyamaria omphalii]
MLDRAHLRTAFIGRLGWAAATSELVAGDASNRRYDRLTMDGDTRILMDAPPHKGEDVRPFVKITNYLRSVGLSAPRIYGNDATHGFLLIEDLGDDLFARLIAADKARETSLYEAAIDVLLHLHSAQPPDLARYDARFMTDVACLSFDWYQRGAIGSIDADARAAFDTAMCAALEPLESEEPVLVQRDYHAENMIWLPDREGVKHIGLLDYQDAMLGHPAYDLVSVLQDARRDVSPEVQSRMLDRYVTAASVDPTAFHDAYALLGLQRNLRILGVFARLSLARGKPHYIDLIPRVWGHIETGLSHPIAGDLAPIIRKALPAPTPNILQSLKDQCQTIPQP